MRPSHILLLLVLISSHALGFKLTPIVQEFSLAKKQRTKSFRVINTNKEDIKIEAASYTREINQMGQEVRQETEDFVVYPPLFEVKAGKSQVIRVSYVGGKPSKEVPYRLIVRQIPNQPDQNKNQLTVILEYVASMYLDPGNTSPDLKILSATIEDKRLKMKIENKGNKHILLNKFKLKLTQGKTSLQIDLKDKDYAEMGSVNMLAGIQQNIDLLLLEGSLKPGKVQAELIKGSW